MNENKPIFSLTVEEFINALREGLGFTEPILDDSSAKSENVKKHYVYGL